MACSVISPTGRVNPPEPTLATPKGLGPKITASPHGAEDLILLTEMVRNFGGGPALIANEDCNPSIWSIFPA